MTADTPDTLSAARRDFDRGAAAALDPDNQKAVPGEPGITNLRCWWLGLRCPECRHTFRPGDRVVESASPREVRHATPELPCAGAGHGEALDPAAADEFFRGLNAAWPPPDDMPVVLVTRDHPLAAPPPRGSKRHACFVCGHTIRPTDKVIICPCSPRSPQCRFVFHCDPEHNRNCWQDWKSAGRERYCPARAEDRT